MEKKPKGKVKDERVKSNLKFKSFSETADYGSPSCEDRTLRDQIVHLAFGTDYTESKMILQEVGHHRVPTGGMLFTLLADVQLTEALKVDSLEGCGRKCELRDVAGGWEVPLQHHWKLRASQGASYGL